MNKNQKGFSAAEGLLILVLVAIVGGTGWYVWQSNNKASKTLIEANSTSNSQVVSDSRTQKMKALHSSQDAVDLVQKTYDEYLQALNKANNNPSNTQPVAQVALTAVKNNLSIAFYSKAAAVTQAIPFSCTAQYAADKYVASLKSSDKTNTMVAVSISNGSGLTTHGMIVTVNLASLKVVAVTCPSQ